MKFEVEEVKAGLMTLVDLSLPKDSTEGATGGWNSEARLMMLSVEVARYLPDLAFALAVAGRSRLAGQVNQASTPAEERERLTSGIKEERPLGAAAMIGFALRNGRAPRVTAEWMKELREGDAD